MDDIAVLLENVDFTYKLAPDEQDAAGSEASPAEPALAVRCAGLVINKGEYVAVLGRNGSGKSTLARLINALLIPDNGRIIVFGMDTANASLTWEIRKSVGLVFQNPDNQIVGTTVEEDVAFGPENLGIEPAEIRRRVDEALKAAKMEAYAENAPHMLSGGQKQRVAVAGIISMHPKCMILDEATSMLDPEGRRELLGIVRKLNREEKITVIHITHNMNEACLADRIAVMDAGSIVMEGTPKEIFSKVGALRGLGLDVPQVTKLFYELDRQGISLPAGITDSGEAYAVLSEIFKKAAGRISI